jgi:hypothetical protein
MKILLALDESSFSQAAIDTVSAQANPRETEVLILHVLEPAYAHGHTLAYVPEVRQIMEEET